jgi:short subunit fatty acids transporter
MKVTRATIGAIVCIASFLGMLYCAYQRGRLCDSLPLFNSATNNTVSFTCAGLVGYLTPLQETIIHRMPYMLIATYAIGEYLRRSRPDA